MTQKIVDRNLDSLKNIEYDLIRSDNSLSDTPLEADIANLNLKQHQRRWDEELQSLERRRLTRGLPHAQDPSRRHDPSSSHRHRPTYDTSHYQSQVASSLYSTYLPSAHASRRAILNYEDFAAKELLRQHAKWLRNHQKEMPRRRIH